jgi:hypothetical protein
MNKSVIVYGPHEQMARHAVRIRKHFGATTVVHGWRGTMDIKTGITVYFTDDKCLADHMREIGVPPVMTFAEVAQQINAAIPKTIWFSASFPPVRRGVYQTCHKPEEMDAELFGYQHWNGKGFGAFNTNAKCAEEEKLWAAHPLLSRPYWRGLAEEPIVVAA